MKTKRKSNSDFMTTQWVIACTVASILDIDKHIAYAGLRVLKDHNLLDDVIRRDNKAIAAAKLLQWYGHDPETVEPKIQHLKPSKIRTETLDISSDIAIMTWAIKTIGDHNRARTAFNTIIKAYR